jgi:hypothetical protein
VAAALRSHVSGTYHRVPPRVALVPASAIQSRPLLFSSICMAAGGPITDFLFKNRTKP